MSPDAWNLPFGRKNYGDMNESFILRSGYDGLGISVMMTLPEGETSAVLQLAHGMRGHKERFLPLMEFLAMNGVACVANDHRGHGESVRSVHDRGYMYSGGYPALVDDMRVVNEWIHAHFPEKPVFLLGHSMGTLAARTYLKNHDESVSGVILCGSPSSSPALPLALLLFVAMNAFRNGRVRPKMIQGLTSWMFNRRFASEGKYAWLSSDRSAQQDFSSDPATSFDFTANALLALMGMMKETYSQQGWKVLNPSVPVYFISGSDDPCMRNEAAFHASVQHMADLGYEDVTSAIYTGMRHEVLSEIGKEAVWEDVLAHILRKQ